MLAGFSHVALTVTDLEASRRFYSETLEMPVIDSNETYCALHTGSAGLSALILSTHDKTTADRFSESRAGLDHVSLAIPDRDSFAAWQDRLRSHGVPFDAKRSEWGHHLNFRDPDNIAVELVLVEPDSEIQAVLDA